MQIGLVVALFLAAGFYVALLYVIRTPVFQRVHDLAPTVYSLKRDRAEGGQHFWRTSGSLTDESPDMIAARLLNLKNTFDKLIDKHVIGVATHQAIEWLLKCDQARVRLGDSDFLAKIAERANALGLYTSIPPAAKYLNLVPHTGRAGEEVEMASEKVKRTDAKRTSKN